MLLIEVNDPKHVEQAAFILNFKNFDLNLWVEIKVSKNLFDPFSRNSVDPFSRNSANELGSKFQNYIIKTETVKRSDIISSNFILYTEE